MRSDRRSEERPLSPSRRGLVRPARWLTLLVLSLGLAILVGAHLHRRGLDGRFASIVRTQESSPYHIAKIRSDLAAMELSRESLDRELQSRLGIARGFQTEQFYVAIDTANHKLRLHFGPEIVRDADVVIGEARTVISEGKTWEFVALKGALTVTGKLIDQPWLVPAWAYAIGNVPTPPDALTVPDGLGKYVILLPNGYVIHSPPPPDSPLHGAKPGSFMIAEDQMRAIWPRISAGTRVYVY